MSSEIEEIRQRKMAELLEGAKTGGRSSTGVGGSPVKVTDADFERFVQEHGVAVVDCWAPWCGPCRMLSPTIDALAKEYDGKAVFGKLNTDENFQTASKYRISSIPTVLYFKDGKLAGKTIGALPKQALESEIRKLLA